MNVRFATEIATAAAAHHLDPRLLAAVAAQETGGPGSDSGANIVGDGGHGHGPFQIDDRYWTFARTPAVMDPAKNAAMAASILSDDLRRYGGDVRRALSAYNAGSPDAAGTTTRWADGRVLGYADSVLRHYDALGGSTAQLAADTREALPATQALHAAASSVPSEALARALTSLAPGLQLPPLAPLAPLTPITSWDKLNESGATEIAAADKAVADLVDSGDVFDSGDDDGS